MAYFVLQNAFERILLRKHFTLRCLLKVLTKRDDKTDKTHLLWSPSKILQVHLILLGRQQDCGSINNIAYFYRGFSCTPIKEL